MFGLVAAPARTSFGAAVAASSATTAVAAACAASAACSRSVGTLAIRRENKNRWERRVALTPGNVKELTGMGVEVLVQPSSLRIFPDEAYAEAGATVTENISQAPLIVGVKEIPPRLLEANKAYMYFAHVIKAQEDNMEALDTLLERNITLIDYERIVDANNQRMVKFGPYAGYAGMIDFFHQYGNRLLAKGYSTPFLASGYSYMYPSLDLAREGITKMGNLLADVGTPRELGPQIFCFAGLGAVGKGALSIFKHVPHTMVTVDDLPGLVANPDFDNKTVFCLAADVPDWTTKNDGGKFDFGDYVKNPDNYTSHFTEKITPYISTLVNCGYWEEQFPRIISVDTAEELAKAGNLRLQAIADIACDIQGGCELTRRSTSGDHPTYIYDPVARTTDTDMYAEGILVSAVDNLPSELSAEASQEFGEMLVPLMYDTVTSDLNAPFEEMTAPAPIKAATITNNGSLTPNFRYIDDLRKKHGV